MLESSAEARISPSREVSVPGVASAPATSSTGAGRGSLATSGAARARSKERLVVKRIVEEWSCAMWREKDPRKGQHDGGSSAATKKGEGEEKGDNVKHYSCDVYLRRGREVAREASTEE